MQRTTDYGIETHRICENIYMEQLTPIGESVRYFHASMLNKYKRDNFTMHVILKLESELRFLIDTE